MTSMGKIAALLLISLVIVPQASLILNTVPVSAHSSALSSNIQSLFIKKLITVKINNKGHIKFNITKLDKMINISSASCGCVNGTKCSSKLNVSIKKLYTINNSKEKLVFASITLYNTLIITGSTF